MVATDTDRAIRVRQVSPRQTGGRTIGLLSKDPVREQAKAEAKAEKARAAEEAQFWASPSGQARRAREEGRTWVQIVAPISETRIGTTGFVTGLTSTDARSRTSDQTGLIESVEAEGGKLEHVGYVFQPTSTASRDKLLSSGQTEEIAGKIVAVYLFHMVQQQNASLPPIPGQA